MRIILILTTLLMGSISANSYSTKSDWLLETSSTQERFKKIQKQLRGFDLAMVEVGYRFNSFYFAIKDKNYPLANYHWDKIKKAIENGVERRPKRESNSRAIFLDTQFKSMRDALNKKDDKLIWQEYNNTKQSCNACHRVEKVPFIEVIDPKYRWQPIK
jgi:cytochrome c556